jgi:hypothetical protein
MRLLFAVVLSTCCFVVSADAAPTALDLGLSRPAARLVLDVKFVCGDFGQGWTCKREPGFNQYGKGKTPGGRTSVGGSSDTAPADGDALPPASGATGYGAPPAPAVVPIRCPENSELLGGHCIPYTQRCTAGIAPTAYPPQCQGEEKQVCSFHPDGSKDCCCRVYSKF